MKQKTKCREKFSQSENISLNKFYHHQYYVFLNNGGKSQKKLLFFFLNKSDYGTDM